MKKMSMTEAAQLQTKLEKLWDTAELETLFGVTAMCLHNWRKGKGTVSTPLPALVISSSGSKSTVRYIPADVIRWGKANKLPMPGQFRLQSGTRTSRRRR